jgi:hypothetical protein
MARDKLVHGVAPVLLWVIEDLATRLKRRYEDAKLPQLRMRVTTVHLSPTGGCRSRGVFRQDMSPVRESCMAGRLCRATGLR